MEDQFIVSGREQSRASATAQASLTDTCPVETFDVQFRHVRGRRAGESDPSCLKGKGRITIDGPRLEFEGRRGRISWLSTKQVLIVAAADVFDVFRAGRALGFKCRGSDGVLHSVDITAANVAQATRLQVHLPEQATPEFAISQAEHSDFHARLDQLSPRAPVVPVLVAINVLVFVAMCVAGVGVFQPDSQAVLAWGSNFGPLTTSGQWWRLLSSTFVHFGLLHVSFNMWALYASGRVVERLFGSTRFVLLYLFAGVAASMVSLLWNPLVNSAGASGAIFGVFGGLLAFVMNPRNAVPQSVMVEHRNSTLLFAGYTLFYGAAHSGIDNAAHIGGLFAGLAMGFVLARPLTAEARRGSSPNRLVLALGAGAIALIALSWPLTHPNPQTLRERQFFVMRERLVADEKLAVAATRQWAQHATAAHESAPQLEAELTTDVVPKWHVMVDELDSARLEPGDRDFELRALLARYSDARLKQFELTGQAIQNNSASLQAESEQQAKQAEQVLAELKSLHARRK